MTENKLKTAVLGLGEDGQLLLEAASKVPHFRIEAVADEDAKLAEKVATEYGCAHYNDYRQLIIQNQFDVLFVAAGIHTCDEHIKLAIKKKFSILKTPPPARNFAETAELAKIAEEHQVIFAVANTGRFAQSYLALHRYLQENPEEKFFLISAVCCTGNENYPPWQSDPQSAGGGVLLCNAYEIIDQIVWDFAVPQLVYSFNTSLAGDKQQRLYLTEDFSILTMKFTDTLFGNLTACRCSGPSRKMINLCAREKTLTVTDRQFVIKDQLGEIVEQFEYSDDRLERTTAMLENIALSLLQPDSNKLFAGAAENLKTMAVIESAYLSSRTAMPEQPDKILKMASRPRVEPILSSLHGNNKKIRF